MNLNLGCGDNKLNKFINIDIEPSVKPDLVHDFVNNKLPYEDGTVDRIVMFHTIEHIEKRFHSSLLAELWRVLKINATMLISYPEFSKCYDNWATNYKGMKSFWEATIFGRQLYKSDYHVCIMDSAEFSQVLTLHGFYKIAVCNETYEPHNTVISCYKNERGIKKYEDLLRSDMEQTVILH